MLGLELGTLDLQFKLQHLSHCFLQKGQPRPLFTFYYCKSYYNHEHNKHSQQPIAHFHILLTRLVFTSGLISIMGGSPGQFAPLSLGSVQAIDVTIASTAADTRSSQFTVSFIDVDLVCNFELKVSHHQPKLKIILLHLFSDMSPVSLMVRSQASLMSPGNLPDPSILNRMSESSPSMTSSGSGSSGRGRGAGKAIS